MPLIQIVRLTNIKLEYLEYLCKKLEHFQPKCVIHNLFLVKFLKDLTKSMILPVIEWTDFITRFCTQTVFIRITK